MKVVINSCYGGFGLSKKAQELYTEKCGKELGEYIQQVDGYKGINEHQIYRADPNLVEVVEQLGKRANGVYAELKVVEVPDDVEWEICEYDGNEWVAECHRTWS